MNEKFGPTEIFASVRKDKQLMVSANLYPWNEIWDENDKIDPPLGIFSRKSRFRITVANNGKAISGHLMPDDIPALIAKDNYAFQKWMDICNKISPAPKVDSDEGSNNADKAPTDLLGFKVTFAFGRHKGMTPADILVREKANGLATLDGERKFLLKILDKNKEANQLRIDAIDDAKKHADVLILDLGERFKHKSPFEVAKSGEKGTAILRQEWTKIKKENGDPRLMASIQEAVSIVRQLGENDAKTNNTSVSANEICIFNAEMRGNAKKKENGLSPVWEMRISYHLNMNKPVGIKVLNYRAPIDISEFGQQIVRKDKRIDTVTNTIFLNIEEWKSLLYKIQTSMRLFEQIWATEAFQDAMQRKQEERETYLASLNRTSEEKAPSSYASSNASELPIDYPEFNYPDPDFYYPDDPDF